jgi:hypothetical protein
MEKLFKIFLILSILGILLLLIISVSLPPKNVSKYSELKGKIISLKVSGNFNVARLNNNITITCDCKLRLNKTIIAEGRVQEYKGTLQINIEKMKNAA